MQQAVHRTAEAVPGPEPGCSLPALDPALDLASLRQLFVHALLGAIGVFVFILLVANLQLAYFAVVLLAVRPLQMSGAATAKAPPALAA